MAEVIIITPFGQQVKQNFIPTPTPPVGYDLTLNFIANTMTSVDNNGLNFKINADPSSDTDFDYYLAVPYAGSSGGFDGETGELINLVWTQGGSYTIHNVTSVTYWADYNSSANLIYINGTGPTKIAPTWASKQTTTLSQNTTINVYYDYEMGSG